VGHGLPVLAAGLLLGAAVAASLTASRLRLPGLVLFLGIGMAVGSDGAGWVSFDDYGVARDAGMLALAVILFDGGLGTSVEELRSVIRPALRLAVLGTIGAAAITGLAAALVLGMPVRQGLLLGAILASTDSAAIFALVRGSSLRRRLARTLEGESGFNDPVAVLLVLGVIGWMTHPGWGVWDLAELFVRQIVGGVLVGMVTGRLAVCALERLPLPAPGLYPVTSLAAAALAYGGADAAGGSGFLAVYLAGLLISDAPIQARQTIAVFHEGAAWTAQIGLFLMLGLLASPASVSTVATEGVLLAVIALAARPAAALLATAGDRFSLPERIVLGWAGLRGAVPVVLATLPVTAGVARGTTLFNIVFIVVVVTTLVQGMTLEPLARALRVTSREPARPRLLADRGTIRRLGAEIVEYPVSPLDGVVGRQVAHLGLPPEATVNVIVRGREAIPPDGSVRIRAGDRLHLLVRTEAAGQVAAIVSRWEGGDAARGA
jgi:potassium/hydrogen antiporter